MAHGETDLNKMLEPMQPILSEGVYVYCFEPYPYTPEFPVWASICEQEGRTLIMRQEEADRQNFSYEGLWRRITLSVHSSLQAVGLTACVSKALSDAGICANIVAGYHHDHIFVQAESAELACDAILELGMRKELGIL